MCCDVAAGRRALRSLANLANQEEPAIHVQPSVWTVDTLNAAGTSRAIEDAVEADHIIVASDTGKLPRVVEQWLGEVLLRRPSGTKILGLWGDRGDWLTFQVQTPTLASSDAARASPALAAA